MKAPGFWFRPPGIAARLLAPLGSLYGAATQRRFARPGAIADTPVICVGNMTLGGSGKTPMALALGRMLIEWGERPVFLTRGYGGRARGPLRVDPSRHSARDVGDEALLLASLAPTIVARDRAEGARLGGSLAASVIVMDDGLQNPSPRKDLAFAVFDAGSGIGNGLCFPAGPLRAPLADQWPLVQAAILIGDGEPGEIVALEVLRRRMPLCRARLAPDPERAAALRGRRVLAFAGIGRPAKFFDTLEACGALIEQRVSFGDHHAFTARDASRLLDEAQRRDLLPVTTEKDRVRLSPWAARDARVRCIETLPVDLVFDDPASLADLVRAALRAKRRGTVDPSAG